MRAKLIQNVAAGERDAHYSADESNPPPAWKDDADELIVGEHDLPFYAYVQFRPNLPASATIESATLTFWPAASSAGTMTVSAHLIDLVDGDLSVDRSAVAVLAGPASLSGVLFTADTAITLSITSLLQTFLTRPGHNPADWLTLRIGAAGVGIRQIHAFEGTGTPMRLTVEYSASRETAIAKAVEDLVANSATFQRITGAASADAARANIYHGATPQAIELPACLIHGLDMTERHTVGLGADQIAGQVLVSLLSAADQVAIGEDGEISDYPAAIGALADHHAAVADDVKALGRLPGYLVVTSVSRAGPTEVEDQGLRVQAEADTRSCLVRSNFMISHGLNRAA